MTSRGRRLRVGIDATPLAGSRSGVGRYVEGILSGFRELTALNDGEQPITPVLTTFSLRGSPPASDRAGASSAPLKFPARLLYPAWSRISLPPVELLAGRVDVFHGTNFMQPPSFSAGVLTIHDLAYLHHADTVTAASRRNREIVPRSIRRAELLICFTDAVRDELCEAYSLAAERVRVIPHGVDPVWSQSTPPNAQQREEWGLPERYVVAVGTVEPRKNLGLLIRAHRAAREANAEVPQLVLVGGQGWGEPWGDAEPDARHVVMTGYLPEERLRAVVAGAQALCMPSHYEGFGLPILEAMATGCDVLASDIAAHREVGGPHITYLPAEINAWAAALADRATREGTDDAASRRAWTQNFTWRRSAAAHIDAYRDAAAS